MIRETRGFPSPFTPFKEVPPGNAKAAENPMLKDKARIVRELEKIIGPNGVICEEDELRVYDTDGLTIFKAMPDVVVLPSSSEQVAEVVKVCHRETIPFVARGSGTGLSGGALPLEGGVLIGLNRVNRILEVDYENKRAVVEPGVINVWLTLRGAGEPETRPSGE